MSAYEKGRTYLLRKIRDDLSPMSVPPRGSLQAAFPTYYEYFVSKWTKKNCNISHIGAHHCPTPSSHTCSFLIPRLDVHTFHHGVTLCILSTSLSLYLVAERAITPSYRTSKPFANNYPSLAWLTIPTAKDGLEEDRNHCPSSCLDPLYHPCAGQSQRRVSRSVVPLQTFLVKIQIQAQFQGAAVGAVSYPFTVRNLLI